MKLYERFADKEFHTSIATSFGIDFAIYKKGDWEIVFHFLKDNPKFEDE